MVVGVVSILCSSHRTPYLTARRCAKRSPWPPPMQRRETLTRSSPDTLLTLPQALMTQPSLNAMTATMSTPLAFSFSRFWIYGGRWLAWQPGVKAPGTETSTTFLPFHCWEASYTWGIPQAVGSSLVIGVHLVRFC